MLGRDWLKVLILILIPISVWSAVLYHLHPQKKRTADPSVDHHRSNIAVRAAHFAQKWGIVEGKQLVYPFPVEKTSTVSFGSQPPVGQGHPVLFLNIAWIAAPEVWEPTIQEILNTSPSLHLVLLFQLENMRFAKGSLQRLQRLLDHCHHPRLSAIAGEWVHTAFGGEAGILLFLCDGSGTVRAVELYPELKVSPSWDEEVKDWRPKLHRAVQQVLKNSFPKDS